MSESRTSSRQSQSGNSLTPTKPRRPAAANGQLARVAQLLRERRTRGLSSLEAIELGILRLPNRIGELRKLGWVISSKREPTECLRYFLVREPAAQLLSTYAERERAEHDVAMPLFAQAVQS